MGRSIAVSLCLLLLLTGCAGKKTGAAVAGEGAEKPLLHATLFGVFHTDDYTTLQVYSPWKPGEVFATYYLVKDKETAVPAGGSKVVIPLENVMVNSATHIGFLDLLGELDKVSGVCNGDYFYNPHIVSGIRQGSVQDIGDSFNLDIERLLLLRPQAMITTAYNVSDENSKRLTQSGLPVLYNVEWQEKTLLGRAEWIKFFGALFDKEHLADSIFSDIAHRYDKVRAGATGQTVRPSVLSGQDYRGAWSMPGGKSFNANLFRDAGVDYFYANDNTSGSISSTIEEALVHFRNADLWVGVQAGTLDELAVMDSKYKLFRAYREGNVYNTDKRANTSGGNDYWEMAVARPDLVLSDMVKIAYPSLLPGYELTYMRKLE